MLLLTTSQPRTDPKPGISRTGPGKALCLTSPVNAALQTAAASIVVAILMLVPMLAATEANADVDHLPLPVMGRSVTLETGSARDHFPPHLQRLDPLGKVDGSVASMEPRARAADSLQPGAKLKAAKALEDRVANSSLLLIARNMTGNPPLPRWTINGGPRCALTPPLPLVHQMLAHLRLLHLKQLHQPHARG